MSTQPESQQGAQAVTVVFVTLAMNQTRFFEAIGQRLIEEGIHVAFICFHEGSLQWLRTRGQTVYDGFAERGKPVAVQDGGPEGAAWPDLNMLLSHEMAAYEVYDSSRLAGKLSGCVASVEAALDDLERHKEPIVLVQELGGFLSNIAAYRVARRRGIDNVFMEPSFFKGRVFFVRNSFEAPKVPGARDQSVRPEVKQYIEDAVSRQQVVIPDKDRRHYRTAVRKLADPYNWRRLVQKLWDKHVRGKREEFEHIGGHVRRHFRMAVTGWRLRRHYRRPPEDGPYIYYPLHVPADVALTLRTPEYWDQYALLDYIARCLPRGYRLVTKEHPALVGAVDYARMRDLLKRNDRLLLADPGINNYELLREAAAVVTVNSKSGAEALLLGRNVVVLGDAFYRPSNLVYRVESLSQLPAALQSAAERDDGTSSEQVMAYFQAVWDRSMPGELYELSDANIERFTDSLKSSLASPVGECAR